MHGIGEKIVYGGAALMEIIDVREERFSDIPRKYYVLRELSSSTKSQTFIPVDNEKLTALMYPVISKNEAEALLSRVSSIQCLEWHHDNRIRAEKFREIIESGNREEIIALIKTVHEKSRLNKKEGKKNSLSDEKALKKAENLLYSELAEVLGITEAEAADALMRIL